MNVSQVLLKIDLVGGGPNHSVDSYVVGENPNGRIRGHVTDNTVNQAGEQYFGIGKCTFQYQINSVIRP